MNEINMIIWPALYGVTGHAVGSLIGMGVAGAIAGVVLGYVTGEGLAHGCRVSQRVGADDPQGGGGRCRCKDDPPATCRDRSVHIPQ